MIRYFLWGLAGLAWSTLAFLLGFYITFPSDTVSARVEQESVTATDKQFSLHMGAVRPWFTGARATDVTVYTLKRARRTKDQPDPGYDRSPLITADSVVVRAKPLAWVLGRRALGFAAGLLGGEIDGDYAESEAAVDVDLSMADVDLAELGLSNADRTLHLNGVLTGEASFHFDVEDTKQSTGSMSLAAEGLGVGEGSAISGFTLPATVFSRAAISAEVENGKIVLREGVFESGGLTASLTGDITINKKVLRSRHKLDFAFTLPEDFDQLAQLSPTLKRSKDEEGRYHCSVNGQLFAPTFRCGKTISSRRNRDTGDGDSPLVGNDRGFEPDMSDEERKAQREERIKERRERLRKRREEAAKTRGEDGLDLDPPDPGLRRPPDLGEPEFPDGGPMPFVPEDELPGPPDVDLAPPEDNWVPGDDQTR